eukprot:1249265-Pyramimonas_sp.AAC.1
MSGPPLRNRPRPHRALSGLTVSDAWGTAAAKDYPSGLGKALASSLLQEARGRYPEIHVDGITGRGGPPGSLAHSSPGGMRWTLARETALRSALDLDSAGDDL